MDDTLARYVSDKARYKCAVISKIRLDSFLMRYAGRSGIPGTRATARAAEVVSFGHISKSDARELLGTRDPRLPAELAGAPALALPPSVPEPGTDAGRARQMQLGICGCCDIWEAMASPCPPGERRSFPVLEAEGGRCGASWAVAAFMSGVPIEDVLAGVGF